MNDQSDTRPERGSYQRSDDGRAIVSKGVYDCPELCACYAEGYVQGEDKAFSEMSNFDWTQHTRGRSCES